MELNEEAKYVEEMLQSMYIWNFSINMDWFYHAFSIEDLESILKNGILSYNERIKNRIRKNNERYGCYNGKRYISLAKRPKNIYSLDVDMAYKEYTLNDNSIVVSGINPIRAKDKFCFHKSIYGDEYLQKKCVPTDKFIYIATNISSSHYLHSYLYELSKLKQVILDIEKFSSKNLEIFDNYSGNLINKEQVLKLAKDNKKSILYH